mmetsp:Transcript_54553/g.116563  ORF Transcript_54553/g.116563 Transcript_54553/m.116563 type:complete len:102 (-) Transcript_54553:463-768(-)
MAPTAMEVKKLELTTAFFAHDGERKRKKLMDKRIGTKHLMKNNENFAICAFAGLSGRLNHRKSKYLSAQYCKVTPTNPNKLTQGRRGENMTHTTNVFKAFA